MSFFNDESGKKTAMLNVMRVILGSCLLCVSQWVSADAEPFVGLIDNNRVIEDAGPLKISLDEKSLTGFVDVEICNYGCEDARLTITPETVAYQGLTKVPLKEARKRLGKFAEVIYDDETKNVVRISW